MSELIHEFSALTFHVFYLSAHHRHQNGSKRTTPITSPDMPYGAMRDSGSSYGMTPPGSAGSSSRSMSTYSTGSPHSNGSGVGMGAPMGGLTGREGYSYGSLPVDARRKVNAFGSNVGAEPPWRTDFDPARPRGISGSAGPLEFSPRQGIQRAMLANRAYPSTVPPPQLPQQAHDQHMQYGGAPRMSRSQAYAMAQQQQQQQPPQQIYAPNAYPRHLNRPPPQQQPFAPPLPPPQPHDPRQFGAGGGVYPPPPARNTSMPLYARQGGSYNTSPQLQPRELDVSRYSLGGPAEVIGGQGAGPGVYSQQSLYQRGSLPERSGNGGAVNDVHGYNDILRDIDVSLRLGDYVLPDAGYSTGAGAVGNNGSLRDSGANGIGAPGLSNISFSSTFSRPTSLECDRTGSGPNTQNAPDDQKWY
jgi:hypothetical protein